MPFIPVPNTAQVEVVARIGAETVQNVLHYSGGDNTDPIALTNLAGAINLLWETHVAPLISNRVVGSVVSAIDLSTQFGAGVEVLSTWSGGIDNAVDEALPNNVALAFKKSTGLRGRSFRGRIYHYGLTESQVALNTVDTTVRANLEVAYNQLITVTAGSVDWTMQVVSRYSEGAPRATGIATPVIDIASVDGVVDTQRRRLPGRGA